MHSARIPPKGNWPGPPAHAPRNLAAGESFVISASSRNEYVAAMRHRYARAARPADGTALVDKLVPVAGFPRNDAIRDLRRTPAPSTGRSSPGVGLRRRLPAIAPAMVRVRPAADETKRPPRNQVLALSTRE